MTFTSRKEAEDRLAELRRLLADPEVLSDSSRLQSLGREHSHVEEVVETWKALEAARTAYAEAEEMIEESEDEEFIELARAEMAESEEEAGRLERRLRGLLIPRDPDDSRNTIVEIRAGTGGDEAALFAGDLYRMYTRYAERVGWRVEVMSSNPSGMGGYKEVIFLVGGEEVYGKLRYESGVHRVQRVPETETQGRIHTSAASVVVLPEAEEVDVEIEPNELRVDVFRSSGPGGQSVNTTDSAVRITHVPTGLVVSCQDEKSQHKNKAKAMKILRSRLLEKARAEQAAEEAAERRSMVGSGDRSAKIRTYNFPQNRMTDHRIKLTLYNLDDIMDGDLEEVIEELRLALSGEEDIARTLGAAP
ncbi:MAG: peptide chain release factor 1 [bacterium]